MTQDRENSDAGAPITPVERLLQEASAAESAGVFGRTPIDATRMLRESSQVAVPLSVTIGRKWMPVAAAVGLAVVVSSAMFYVNLSDASRQSRLVTQAVQAQATPHDAEFAGAKKDLHHSNTGRSADSEVAGSAFISVCVSGPEAVDSAKCRGQQYDYDTDGDIDLADFSHYQLAFVQ